MNYIPRPIYEEKIENRRKLLSDHRPVLLTVIYGLGGAGKTLIASRYAQNSTCYKLRVWISAQDGKSLIGDYLRYGASEGLFDLENVLQSDNKDSAIKEVRDLLEQKSDCLIIFDNAEDMDSIAKFLPKKGGAHILITSRKYHPWRPADCIHVEGMEPEEAIKLVRDNIGPGEHDDNVKKLVERLGCIALAVAQASAYINKYGVSIDKYLIEYAKYLSEPDLPNGDKHDPITITWKITFDAIQEKSSQAMAVTHAVAFMEADKIPDSLLKKYIVLKCSSHFEGMNDERIDKEFNHIKGVLMDYLILKLNRSNNFFVVHRLIQDMVRKDINIQDLLLLTSCLSQTFVTCLEISDVSQKFSILSNNFNLILNFITFIERILSIPSFPEIESFFDVLLLAGKLLSKTTPVKGDDKSLRYSNLAYKYFKKINSSTKTFEALNYLIETKYWLGMTEGTDFFEQALSHLHEANGFASNPNQQAYVIGWLGSLHLELKDVGKAIEYHKEALKLEENSQENVFHPSYIIESILDLARDYCYLKSAQGFSNAIEEAKKALKLINDNKKSGDSLAFEGFCWFIMGNGYLGLGKFADALECHKNGANLYAQELHYSLAVIAMMLKDVTETSKNLINLHADTHTEGREALVKIVKLMLGSFSLAVVEKLLSCCRELHIDVNDVIPPAQLIRSNSFVFKN